MATFVNISAFNKFIDSQFDGNLTKASKETNISKSTFCLIKKGLRDVGTSTFCKLNKYCTQKGIDINTILFF